MNVVAILAVALLAKANVSAPQQIQPYSTLEACLVEAEKRNRNDEDLRTPQARDLGAEYICLEIKRVRV